MKATGRGRSASVGGCATNAPPSATSSHSTAGRASRSVQPEVPLRRESGRGRKSRLHLKQSLPGPSGRCRDAGCSQRVPDLHLGHAMTLGGGGWIPPTRRDLGRCRDRRPLGRERPREGRDPRASARRASPPGRVRSWGTPVPLRGPAGAVGSAACRRGSLGRCGIVEHLLHAARRASLAGAAAHRGPATLLSLPLSLTRREGPCRGRTS